jgi:glycosyltransferase involved in cell wall biosynthesis
MRDQLSVIIPTLNEAKRLPALLQALQAQTRPPDEIIVADADSQDETALLARQAGARVTRGGRPAAGRNAGARAAQGDLLLFLDADVLPPPFFIETLLREFHRRRLDVAAPLIAPLEPTAINFLVCEVTNLYLQVMESISPHAPGFCLLARRTIHEQIGGFDETVLLAEDHRYAQMAAQVGRFGMIKTAKIPVSMRRLEKEGLVRLAFKYAYSEIYALSGRPIHSLPFTYEFGHFPERGRALVNIEALRKALGRLSTPLNSLSETTRRALQTLGQIDVSLETFLQALDTLKPDEISTLERYLRRRVRLLRALKRLTVSQARAEMLWLESKLPDSLAAFFHNRPPAEEENKSN